MSHPLELEQQGGSEEKDAYLFSNPTFESYLDPVSDDELQLMEGCTTPRSAIKQQASQTTIHTASPSATSTSARLSSYFRQQTRQQLYPLGTCYLAGLPCHNGIENARCRRTLEECCAIGVIAASPGWLQDRIYRVRGKKISAL